MAAAKKTKKREVKQNTKVKVYNNIFNNVGFETASGRRINLPKNGSWKEILVEDADYILNMAPAMFKEGILFIEDEDVREYLDISEYYTEGYVIASDKIEGLLESDDKELEDALKKASKSTKAEIAKKAKERSDDLTGSQVKIIEKETGMEVTDKF